jgi:hypothetical protein
VAEASGKGRSGRPGRLHSVLRVGRERDPQEIADEVRTYAAGRRWLLPLLYVGQTIDSVLAGVWLLLGNWRLLLLELVPALWLGAITWDWRVRTFGRLPLAEVHGLVALGVVLVVLGTTLVAYWCNSVFAFTAVQPSPVDLSAAFASARSHARRITTWALAAGGAHAVVAVAFTRTNVLLYSIALGAVVLVQMYGLVALPVALVAQPTKKLRTRGERAARLALNGALSGVASTPGFLLNRIGILLFAVGLPWLGVAVLVPAVVFQAAGAASSRAVQLAARVQEANESGEEGAPDACNPVAPEPPPEP